MQDLEKYETADLEVLASEALRILKERTRKSKEQAISEVILNPENLKKLLANQYSVAVISEIVDDESITYLDVSLAVDKLFADGKLG